MNILIISNLCPPDYDGGFELSALRNAESLRSLGHHVEFVTGKFRATFQGEKTDPPWIHRIFELPPSIDNWSNAKMFLGRRSDLRFSLYNLSTELGLRYSNFRGLLQMMKRAPKNEAALDEFLEHHRFDAAYVFGLHQIGTSVIRSLMKKNIPVLYHQGDEWLANYMKPGRLKRVLLIIANPVTFFKERKIDLNNVVLVSEFMKERFVASGFKEHQLAVIYRGVEFPIREDFERERYGPPVFLLASRLTLYKGIHIAIRAASVLDRRSPETEWEMWIAGHGDVITMKYFTDLIVDLNIGHRVKFIGKHSRSSTFAFMQRATAIITPSVFDEPFGNTNIEALASGTVLIASQSGAIEEIIDHGKSGLIYDRFNIVELVYHMKLVLRNKALRQTLQVEGQNRIREKFTQDQIIRQVEERLAVIANLHLEVVVNEGVMVSVQ